MVEQLTAFIEMLNVLSLDHHLILREGDAPLRRLKELRELGAARKNDELLVVMSPIEPKELVRVYAALSIQPESLNAEQIAKLQRLLVDDDSLSLKIAIARQLRLTKEIVVLDKLFHALIRCEDPQLRSVIAFSIAENHVASWQAKVDHFINVLYQTGFNRENLDLVSLKIAISPQNDEILTHRYVLTDYLISKTVGLDDQRERVIGVVAGLIIECVGNSIERANQRVKKFEADKGDKSGAIALLRAEINGLLISTDRLVQIEKSYIVPLQEANNEVRKIWESSIRNVEKTLRLRQILGGLGTLLGLLVLLIAVWLLSNNRTEGGVIAIVGVCIGLLALLYGGRVKDYKQILTEIGAANIVYSAYIHRLLRISNSFRDLFIMDQFTQAKLRESDEMINKAMEDTIRALRSKGETSVDDFLNQLREK